jgi:hypothetical protein
MKKIALVTIALLTMSIYPVNATVINEGFESEGILPLGWSLSGAAYLWTRTDDCSGYGIGTGCAKADFYNAVNGKYQDLITLTCTPTGTNDSLYFDHAYATSNPPATDSMVIWTSVNGGASWNHFMLLEGGNKGPLNTGGGTSDLYVPDPTEWATKKYALPAGTNKIKFTAYSEWGEQSLPGQYQSQVPSAGYGCLCNRYYQSGNISECFSHSAGFGEKHGHQCGIVPGQFENSLQRQRSVFPERER